VGIGFVRLLRFESGGVHEREPMGVRGEVSFSDVGEAGFFPADGVFFFPDDDAAVVFVLVFVFFGRRGFFEKISDGFPAVGGRGVE
jgi:hypothetical protein